MLLDLPGFSETLSLRTGDRDTALGMNPNSLASLAAVAGVLLIGLLLSAAFKGAWVQAFFASLILPLLVVSVKTGSRAGIGIFVIGCAIYLLPYWPSRHRVSVFIFALCGIAGMLYLVIQDPTAFTRWQMTFKEGDLTGRDKIFSEAVSMISEKPLFGWQPVEFQIELGTRTGVIWGNRDAHNLFFHFLLEVGMVGAIPFFIGLWLCGRAAWRARKGSLGLLPLAVFLSIMAGSLSHTGVANKHLWLVLAVTTASESALFYTRRAQMRGRAAIKTMKRHA
jgi:O-antigen ligase